MIQDDIAEFAACLTPGSALAGLDLGTKTIGVAVSDGLRQVASPLTTSRSPSNQIAPSRSSTRLP